MRTEEYIPKRVKELCSKHKVSKYRLAQLTDMSQTALANIMNKKSIPTVPTLERICDAFGISIAQFFAGDGMRPDLTDEQGELLEICLKKEVLLGLLMEQNQEKCWFS